MSELKPLRIEWQLAGHVALPERYPLMLDAILLAARGDRLPLPFPRTALPIKTIKIGQAFVWLTSWLELDLVGPAEHRQTFRNARPLSMLESAKHLHASTVKLDKGITRTVKSSYLTRQATGARAWCIGDPDGVSELLGKLTHLGGRRHSSYGQVTGYGIEEDEEALVRAWQRPLPEMHKSDPFKAQRVANQGPFDPPYWSKTSTISYWPNI